MTFPRIPVLAVLLLFLAGAAEVAAQIRDPLLRRPVERPKVGELMIGIRYVSGIEVGFSNVGAYQPDYGELTLAPGETAQFENGFITLPESELPGLEGVTTNYRVDFVEQLADTNSNDLVDQYLFDRYSVDAAAGSSLDSDIGGAGGWEVQYLHKLLSRGKSLEMGVLGGFSFSSTDSESRSDLSVAGTWTQVALDVDEVIDLVPDAGGTEVDIGGSQITPGTGPAIDTSGGFTETDTPFTGTSTSLYDVQVAFYNFRVGPYLNWNLTEKILLQFGAGFAASYLSTEATSSTFLSLTPDSTTGGATAEEPFTTARYSSRGEETEFLFGGYVDANASYRFTESMRLYTGVQFQTSEDVEQSLDNGATADIELGSTVHISVGMGFSF